MSSERWYTANELGFAVRLPPGWEVERDEEEGGIEVWQPEGAGVLHLFGFAAAGPEAPDPGEELFAFLEEQGVELEEDEVEDVELPDGGLAFCEYLSEDEDSAEPAELAYWMVGVAVLPMGLVFAHYTCAAGEESREREVVREVLSSLRPANA